MVRWIAVGTVAQLGMVLVGHEVEAVAALFGPVGVLISLLAGLFWARSSAEGWSHGAGGGAFVGGACALLGIAVSWLLGDVTASILAFGTASSAVTGALGGLMGYRIGPRPRSPEAAGAGREEGPPRTV